MNSFHLPLFTSLLLILAMIFFVACGDDDDDDSDATNTDDDSVTDDDSIDDDDAVDDDQIDDDIVDDDVIDDDEVDDDATDDDTVGDDDTTDDDMGDDDTLDDDLCDPDPLIDYTYDESGEAGPLRLKAMAHDAWLEQWHLPDYGSHLHVQFTDETQSEVLYYHGHGDSCIWTGTYITSQALRYHVTGDAQAKANVVRSAAALSRHLHVTGRNGFIARYDGVTANPGHAQKIAACPADENCHIIEEGEFAGDFWIGNTSRDQYTGWFMGMGFAYDLVDDEDMRAQIRADVTEVLDQLMEDNWTIIDYDGEPTTKAPNVLIPMRMSWLINGYNITGQERFLEEFRKYSTGEADEIIFRLNNISFINKYVQHYGLNLAHENFLNLLRLTRPYCDIHQFILDAFREQTHFIVNLAHNPWYTAVFLAQGDEEDEEVIEENRDQIIEDLTDFPEAPKEEYAMTPPAAELDPFSVLLVDLQTQYPWLADLMGTANLQALEAYPVRFQCSSGFIFQRSMWAIECSGVDNPAMVNSGHDYLIAYWLASAYKVLSKTD